MKKFWIVFCIIICFLCLGMDVWCGLVYKYGEEKLVSNTVNLDIMENADGTDKKAFMEINYYSNKNKNGLELFEIKYNYFMDENLESFTSVGSQYVADSSEDTLIWQKGDMNTHWEDSRENYGFANLGLRIFTNVFFNMEIANGASYYEYQSSNDYEFSIGNDINPLNEETGFKVVLSNEDDSQEIYRLEFAGAVKNENYYLGEYKYTTAVTEDINYQYAFVDYSYFASKIYDSIKGANYASDEYQILEFADFFKYKKFNGKSYVDLESQETSKVKEEFNNYYVVKINISEDGANNAEDSMFNQIHGDANFNLNNEYISTDYFYGKSVINVDIDDFDLVQVKNNIYSLVLKNAFVENYIKYNSSIVLDVQIDLDVLNDLNIEFFGFTEESRLDAFKIYECTTIETIDGSLVESEVAYV